jgi:LacI family transcriptional regulator
VIPDVTNTFYAEIAKGVIQSAEKRDYAVLLFDTDDQPDRELHQLEMLARHRSAGALIVPRKADQKRLNRLRDLGMHIVLIDRVAPEQEGCSVSIDDERGGLLAAGHLIESGRRRLALVNGPTHIPQCAHRRDGMLRALSLADMRPSDLHEITVAEMSSTDGERAAQEILRMSPIPNGVFCINDQLAVGVIRGLARAGVGVPDDVAVVGYGDSALAASAPVPLTTIRQPMFDLGRAAVDHLLSEVEVPSARHHHSSTVFTPSLIPRRSAP